MARKAFDSNVISRGGSLKENCLEDFRKSRSSKGEPRLYEYLLVLEIRIQHEFGLKQSRIGLKDLVGRPTLEPGGLYTPYPYLLVSIPILIYRKDLEIGE